jgi:uncharacterized membrane protein YphA (DoxX/SURF4 family)
MGVIRPWLGLGARVILGVVFAIAGWAKVSDLAGSGRAVNAYQLMPFGVAKVIGAALPFVELTLAALLIVGLATRLAAACAAGLLTVFLIGISSVWARGLSIDCGCFGGGGTLAAGVHPNYFWDLVRDLVLLALAVVLFLTPRTPVSIDSYVLGPPQEAS